MSEEKLEYIRGGAIHACATSLLMKTGTWRVFRPEVDMSACKLCKLCKWFCPDDAIMISEDSLEFDFDYCKGCGICAEECPTSAIKMEREEG